MAVELIFAPEVEQDVGEAYGWYELRRPGLGVEFLSCVDACLQSVCRQPELYSKIHQEYRRAIVRRFPYVVFFEHDGNTVTIYGVLHTSRDPEKCANDCLDRTPQGQAAALYLAA
jgi:plasmid stabilization system protein ParE